MTNKSSKVQDEKKVDVEAKSALSMYCEIGVEKLVKADWNYKKDDPEKAEKLAANIKRNRQIQNLIVRELEDGFYEVVNGNHRYDVLLSIGITSAVCCNLGKISLAHAQRIAIETNETTFDSDPLKLADLIKEINHEFDVADLVETMPYTQENIDSMLKITDFNWENFDSSQEPDIVRDHGDSVGDKKIVLLVTKDKYDALKSAILAVTAEFKDFVKVQ